MENINYYILLWIAIGIVSFPFIIKYTAPYGRHSSSNWGKLIDNKIGWLIMELPALMICPFIFFFSSNEKSIITIFFISLWVIHYFNRTIIYPNRIKTRKKKMPILIVFLAIVFNLVNGGINGYYFGYVKPIYEQEWVYQNNFTVGLFIFLLGMLINMNADNKLINLRLNKEDSGYQIPRGGLFNFISCPNFFGEIIEWLGFAIMTWSLAGLSFFIWTFINLVPRALSHHNWYIKNFENYPKERKAIFPFII